MTKLRTLTKFSQLFEEDFLVRLLADLMNVDVSHDALLVDEKDRSFRHPLLAQDAVFLRDVTVRPKI